MANRQTRARIKFVRKAKEHFHGEACDTARKPPRKPRDENRKLRALSDKRMLDKRITSYAAGKIYA